MFNADTVVILDFETTGLSPDGGDRAIEIGAVKLENGQVTGRFQELMNPGRRVSGFIESYTGISNAMLAGAAENAEVMARFADFIGDFNLVAHNASFDKRFLDAELGLIGRQYPGQFVCSMLLARRLFQAAPDYKLGTLVRYANIPVDGVFHRALYDSEMTAKLWLAMLAELASRCALDVPGFELLYRISKMPKKAVPGFIAGL
ncbi:3'-5' exonuclease [Marinobacterium rhizophilum]|uniref:DNA-directed DNA polymerase n=1 Tax=Marinobacterium rhizophilum TaxID=420402 RepID=A0ABY5HM24_9GAMM|nr:3'-5' exonuclease [Marinobacterium rhizophilum]UTW13004.1 3'-5' exonuclease [Marinobacterium rhizophilum]